MIQIDGKVLDEAMITAGLDTILQEGDLLEKIQPLAESSFVNMLLDVSEKKSGHADMRAIFATMFTLGFETGVKYAELIKKTPQEKGGSAGKGLFD